MTEDRTPDTSETDAGPAEAAADTPTQEDFVRARKRRNVMIAWSLVAFMVLVFSVTAIRLSQNLTARQEAAAAEQDAEAMIRDEAEIDE